jgi:hypothetical protein
MEALPGGGNGHPTSARDSLDVSSAGTADPGVSTSTAGHSSRRRTNTADRHRPSSHSRIRRAAAAVPIPSTAPRATLTSPATPPSRRTSQPNPRAPPGPAAPGHPSPLTVFLSPRPPVR